MPADESRVRATIYGQAVGDALGLPVEFKSAKFVKGRIGSGPDEWPSRYVATHRRGGLEVWQAGEWSDDTEQALCILDAYLEGVEAGRNPAEPVDLRAVAQQFLRWAATNGRGMGSHTAKVFEHPLFTLEPQVAASDVWEQSGRTAAPNGAVMRTAYVGVLRPWDVGWTANAAAEVAATTHADPRCVASAVAVSVAIATLVTGGTPGDAWAAAVRHGMLHDEAAGRYVVDATLESLKLDEGLDEPRSERMPPIGFTYKCLGAAFWALRHALRMKGATPQERFTESLESVIFAGGDTDTNGAVAGSVLGAYLGLKAIPPNLVAGLTPRSALDGRVTRLLAVHAAQG
jgi:ADP-ribosylglycohydrolase